MKHYFLPLFLLLAASCSQTDTTTVGALTLPAHPHAGDEIKLQYNRRINGISGEKDFQIILYYTVKKNIYAKPVALSDTGNPVKASFILPDSAQSFALKFQAQPDIVDKENRYIFPVYDHNGKPLAGALAGMSLFYNDIGSPLLGSAVDKDKALALMNMDFKAHPEIKHRWMDTYLNTLLATKKKTAYAETQTLLQQMLSPDSVQEGDYRIAYKLYLQMGMWEKADSMMAIGPRKFPDGEMAKYVALTRFPFVQSSVDSMLLHYQHFKQRFPATDMQGTSAKMQDIMLRKIANQYADQGDYQKFMYYISKLNNPLQKASAYSNMATELSKAGKAFPFADSISKISLHLIEESMNHPGQEKQTYQTNGDWKEKMQRMYAGYADSYAGLLSKEGKIKEAVAYQKQAIAYSNGENSLMNEHYLQYLINAKDYETAQKLLEEFIVNGQATDKLTIHLKPIYVHLNHTEKGYTEYYHTLEEKAKAKLKTALAKEIMDKPAPDFKLPDLRGKWVSLAALKGKVVVLDFWATWCEPCKASLPGMQKIVDNFKNDSNVVFLFINTGERTSPQHRYKQVSDFISNNKYTFRVLLDQLKADDSTQYQVINDYNINAIPTKFVIDPKGHIRFEKLGFSGSTPAEAREVIMMVEMASR